MASDHFIHLYLSENYGIQVEWKCEADSTADCRNYCEAEGCEEGCQDYEGHRSNWVGTANPVTGRGYCNSVLYLEEGGTWDEMYEGPDADVHSGPIVLNWEGDGYSWRYA